MNLFIILMLASYVGAMEFLITQLEGAYLTWPVARSYCLERSTDLCMHDEICSGSTLTVMDPVSGDTWVPVLDQYNDWTEIGTVGGGGRVCQRHVANFGLPSWGLTIGPCAPFNTSPENCPLKSFVLCCPSDNPAAQPGPYPYNIYHFVLDPNFITWSIVESFCQAQRRELCYSHEICPVSEPVITGAVYGDTWTPIRDTNANGFNDWMEIGLDNNGRGGRMCFRHTDHFGNPAWGDSPACAPFNDANGICRLKRHVFCCSEKVPERPMCW